MDRMWSQETSIKEIHDFLSHTLQEKLGFGELICNKVKLSDEDFLILCDKACFVCSPGLFDRYALLVICAWALGHKRGMSQDLVKRVKSGIRNMEQHHTKHVLDLLESEMHDYRIETFGRQILRFEDLDWILSKHHE